MLTSPEVWSVVGTQHPRAGSCQHTPPASWTDMNLHGVGPAPAHGFSGSISAISDLFSCLVHTVPGCPCPSVTPSMAGAWSEGCNERAGLTERPQPQIPAPFCSHLRLRFEAQVLCSGRCVAVSRVQNLCLCSSPEATDTSTHQTTSEICKNHHLGPV